MIAGYPEPDAHWQGSDVGASDVVIEAVRAIRNIRADLNVAPSTAIDLLVFGDGETRLRPYESYLRRLAGVQAVDYRNGGDRPKGAASAVVSGLELVIPLAGLIDDPAAEIARNKKQ